jgi:hypothetical protein
LIHPKRVEFVLRAEEEEEEEEKEKEKALLKVNGRVRPDRPKDRPARAFDEEYTQGCQRRMNLTKIKLWFT